MAYTPFFTQRWARAYRDNHYHVAVNTNNGVEAQNKLFKYKFLPRTKQRATLSSTMTILVEKYLPACKQKYLFQNYKQSPQYRSYKEFVPSYLHNRPRSVILHCLDRKTKSTKFSAHAIHDLDTENGIFEVEKSSDSKQVVNFGVKEQTACLPVHAKTGNNTISHANISLLYLSTDLSGSGSNFQSHIYRVLTSQVIQTL